MKNLGELLNSVETYSRGFDFDKVIEGISYYSREVSQGFLFVAIDGVEQDGHKYIPEAIENGASAIIYSNDLEFDRGIYHSTDFVKVLDSRVALAVISSNFYGNPKDRLRIIGVTGTNGKTTTCEFIYKLLEHNGKRAGLISTVCARFGGKDVDTGFHVTTPNPPELHKILKEMADSGCEFVVLETTSHALHQKRVYGVNFEVSAVTNITREHLDYHKTYEEYVKAKSGIFENSSKVILNKHDPALPMLLEYAPDADVINYKDYSLPRGFSTIYPGEYNKENFALACDVIGQIVGEKPDFNIKFEKPVSGRFDRVAIYNGVEVFIDFAHTPDALQKVLKTARNIAERDIILVFGCAGERDAEKRPVMGEIAGKLADVAIVTAEDPRREKLEDINEMIEEGLRRSGAKKDNSYYLVSDRKEAIKFAVKDLASKGDLVLITGKGHEKSMNFSNVEYPWSDYECVKEIVSG